MAASRFGRGAVEVLGHGLVTRGVQLPFSPPRSLLFRLPGDGRLDVFHNHVKRDFDYIGSNDRGGIPSARNDGRVYDTFSPPSSIGIS